MTTGVLILVLAVLSTAGVAAYRSRTDGRFGPPLVEPAETAPAVEPAETTDRLADGPAPWVEPAETAPLVEPAETAPLVEPAETPPLVEPAETADTTFDRLADAVSGAELGGRATLVQFSTAFCAPCRATRILLDDVAAREDGVTHVEVDAEHHLDLVRELGVRRTPTTLVLDASGAELTRAAGAPRRDQVLAALPAASGSAG